MDRLVVLTQFGGGSAEKRVDFMYNAIGQATSLARYEDRWATELVGISNDAYDDANRLLEIDHDGVDSSGQSTQIQTIFASTLSVRPRQVEAAST